MKIKLKLLIAVYFIVCIHEIYVELAVLKSEINKMTPITEDLYNLLNLQNNIYLLERLKRNIMPNESDTLCGTVPCGFCAFQPNTEENLYYISNTCRCLDSQKCVKYYTKYSGSYYVYHCSDKLSDDSDQCIPD